MIFSHEFQKTAFFRAVEKGNIEVIKFLLSCNNINVNSLNIREFFFLIEFRIFFFNIILNYVLKQSFMIIISIK